jgi:NADH-quinone oxidoreductase subunit J
VLFLIFSFFNAAALFVLLGAEFVAMILVIVYVGAVAVLFLFVVMMLDINFAELRRGAMRYVPVGLLLGLILLAELVMLYTAWAGPTAPVTKAATAAAAEISNTEAIGLVLYTTYALPFQVAGLILLVAMLGAIVLTLRHRPDVRRQKVGDQVARKPSDAMEIRKVANHEGAV